MSKNEPEFARGAFASAQRPAHGSLVRFGPATLTFDVDARAHWIPEWKFCKGILLAVGVLDDHGPMQVGGSAAMVAPGVALCASHVLYEHCQSLIDGTSSAVCMGITSKGLQLWNVEKMTPVGDTDIAILGLRYASALPNDAAFHMAQISTRLPSIGETLYCLGFRASDVIRSFETQRCDTVHGQLLLTTGKVTQQFLEGRDRLCLHWPALEVDCPAWGGMSGGPVFDEAGLLVGLVSKSWQTADEPSPSYVSLLWRALGTRFTGGWPIPAKEPISLIEMHRLSCSIDRRDAIATVVEASGETRVTFLPWR